MAKFDKLAVLKKIGDTGMVPVFYHKDLDVCKNVVKPAMKVVSELLSLLIEEILPMRFLVNW